MNLYRGEGNLPDLMLPGCEGTLPFPIKFGYQVIGEIVEAPDGSPWEVGRHVFCAFPHQERFHLDPSSGLAQPVPADIDLRSAMFAGMFGVALNASKDGPVRPGDVVAISGLGLIGQFQAHLARKAAGKLVLVEPNPERRKRAEWIGADAIVAPDEAPAAIEELAEGRGVDFFFEASGAPPALQLALDTTGVAGTIVPIAWYGTRTVSLRLSGIPPQTAAHHQQPCLCDDLRRASRMGRRARRGRAWTTPARSISIRSSRTSFRSIELPRRIR